MSAQQRVAALVSGRDAVLACEELALRARGDLTAGRVREGALKAEAALGAAHAELAAWCAVAGMEARLARLEDDLVPVADAAAAARQGRLEDRHAAGVDAALGRLEAALRARAAAAAAAG